MLKYFVRIFSILIFLISLFGISVCAAESYETFSYSYDGNIQITPDAYDVENVLLEINGAGALKNPQDIVYDKNSGCFFIADSGNNRIIVTDGDLNAVHIINRFNNNQKSDALLNPMGVFVAKTGYIYVADTDNGRIIVFDRDYNFWKEIPTISADILPENFKYNPKAVAVDSANRVYVVSLNTNMGVIVLNENGEFESFIGAQKVSANAVQYIRRSFMTEEQLARTQSYVPVEYSNLTIDSKGFIYVTCSQINRYDLYSAIWSRSTTSTYAPIKKINPSGTDVLKRNGFFPPAGNILFGAYDGKKSSNPSEITEVELLDNGIYALIDSGNGKLYFYDSNGNLLYAFGGKGSFAGLYNSLCGITHKENTIYALDSASGSVTVLNKTEYGVLIDTVLNYQEHRQYDKAAALWEHILSKNNNFDMAYLGIGKNFLENEKYKDAMEYFKLIGNKTYFGQAFKLYREEILEKYGLWIFIAVVLIITAVIFIFKKINEHNEKALESPASGKLTDQLLYSFYLLRHPLQGFWGIKAEKRGSVLAATIILIITAISSVISALGGSYLKSERGSLTSAFTIILGLLLFVVCNMCFTSLMDGKGTFKDVYTAVCYSSVPYALFTIPCTLISYFLVLDELSILGMVSTMAFCWMIILVALGSMTVHDYSFGKNILVCCFTIVGILFLLFIVLVFISLSGQMLSDISSIVSELNNRM